MPKVMIVFFDMTPVLEPCEPDYIKSFDLYDHKGAYYLDVAWNRPSASPRPNLCYEYKGFVPPHASGWKIGKERMEELDANGEIVITGEALCRKIRPGKGSIRNNLWADTSEPKGDERTGSPDQKPEALYERIIKASSNEGDLVLDPFCGCATTLIAARSLKRRWVGIDRRKDARWHVVTRMAGINKKERERLEKYALDPGWLDRQMAKYEAHYSNTPPERTDEGESAASALKQIYPASQKSVLRHAEMHKVLVKQWGLECWGCSFTAPDGRYLELDHIDPRSSGGTNNLDNRALLCRPCNQKKSNKFALEGLWRENRKEGYLKVKGKPFDIAKRRDWARQHLAEIESGANT